MIANEIPQANNQNCSLEAWARVREHNDQMGQLSPADNQMANGICQPWRGKEKGVMDITVRTGASVYATTRRVKLRSCLN